MTDAYRYEDIETQKARAPGARMRDDASPLVTAGQTDPTLRYQAGNREAETNRKHPIKETEEIGKRLNLFHEASKKAASLQQLSQLVEQVTQMAQRALNASASSVLLLNKEDRELVFEVADGQAGKQLKQARISAKSGIAGWVVCHGEPLIVNDVNKDQRFDRVVDTVTGFVTRSIICAPLVVDSQIIGVIEVLNKLDGGNFSEPDLKTLTSVASTAATAIDNAKLQPRILDSYKSTIKVLAAAVDAKDPYACGHSQRVSEYTLLGTSSLPFSRDEREVIEYAALLHDIGKAYIPDRILLKPGPFTAEEWQVMQKHPVIGCNMLKQIPLLEKASKLVLHHHERYDGNGYPDGLKGEATPLGARLIAVADAFDTMTTYHLYRVACNVDYAIEKLRRLSGTQFCPAAVQAFVSGFSKFHFSANG